MFFLNLILIIFIFLIFSDLYLIYRPKSKLKIIPIKFASIKNKNLNKVIIDLKIKNLSQKKETMISSLKLDLDFFSDKYEKGVDFNESISINNELNKTNNNYWPTTIIKSNSEMNIKINISFKNKDSKKQIKYIWLKLLWDNYGHFGLVKKQDCFLINLNKNKSIKKQFNKITLTKNYEAISVKTDLLGLFDEPFNTVKNYCKDIVRNNDILTIGETPLAIMQGRYLSPQNLEYNFYSKILCYFFDPTSSLATACGMQLLINKIGVTRITFSLFIGLLFKLIGIKGIFYRLTGIESSLIDDISGTTVPYDKSIVMGPLNTRLFCETLSKELKIEVAVVDVNDLGGVKILASSNSSIDKILKSVLKTNPAGNDDQKTPIVIVRNKSKN